MNNMNSNKHHRGSNNNSKGILEQILETLKEIELAITKNTKKGKGEAEEKGIPGGTEGDQGMLGHGNQGIEGNQGMPDGNQGIEGNQ